MSSLQDKVAMRHMDMYMEQEEKYTEAVMSDTERLQTKLQSEMASRLNFDLSMPPVRWGPWLYYRRVEEGKQYPVLCRRLASLNEEFISHKSPSYGFDFTSGKRIELKLLDYNQEAQRFGGYAYEELSEISPDHKFLAYTMYDKDNDYFKLSVRNLNSGGIALSDPFSGMTLAWESEGIVHCILKHHQGYFYLFTDAAKNGQTIDNHYLLRSPIDSSSNPRIWENVFIDSKDLAIEDVDFCKSHLQAVHLRELQPHFLPLPKHVCNISPGPNYDYYSTTMRFTISSPVMPDAVVDYDLSNGKWDIVQQQNMLHERTRILYGTALSSAIAEKTTNVKFSSMNDVKSEDKNLWNDLSEFYACEHHNVSSFDGTMVPLTIVYSHKNRKDNQSPGLLHGHGAYGEILDKRCRSELKSLLDRGWIIAYADVRGGGGGGKKWHHDGRRTKKQNSVRDYISCAKYLIEKEIVQENKLAGWGYSVGGLLVASVINCFPGLFRAAVLKVPFLDATNTLLYPILPLTATDYEEFGYPGDVDEFYAIRKFSPYDNIQKDALYPALLVSSSFNTRFGVWEAAKWVARVREQTIYDPKHPILLNLLTDIVEENRYLQCKESAMETAFLIKAMDE
ncbi:putative molybdopterin cofactor sulfurase [Hibiscus syriacus]|uniref:Prolyl endopeptidase n=1 Tax=Hibiscus syriacus TaxID=106335 RepID=A0A6A3A276_HIBSY|nr:putative molybdopterin cofactor sulfurase [Hibiscus syriacus]